MVSTTEIAPGDAAARVAPQPTLRLNGADPSLRVDYGVILDMVEPGARVLDVGCGDGALLELLVRRRGAIGRGMELSQEGVNSCVKKGLSVVQGDADRDLALYPDSAFDFVILSKTIQAVRQPRIVLSELMRIGSRAIVSFPNFAHWKSRISFLSRGRMPITGALPTKWHSTENIHLCTVKDFADLVRELSFDVERAVPISAGEAGAPFARTLWRANWFAEDAVFLLRSK